MYSFGGIEVIGFNAKSLKKEWLLLKHNLKKKINLPMSDLVEPKRKRTHCWVYNNNSKVLPSVRNAFLYRNIQSTAFQGASSIYYCRRTFSIALVQNMKNLLNIGISRTTFGCSALM